MPERRGRYKECTHCGGSFWVAPSEERQRARAYCSKACYSEAQTKPANAECDVCGAAYRAAPHEAARGRATCSRACASAKQETRPKTRKCRWCGKGFESVSRSRRNNFCSPGCRINQSWSTYHDRIDATPGLISKRAAKAGGRTYFRDGRPCSHGHDSLKYVSNNACVACRALQTRDRQSLCRYSVPTWVDWGYVALFYRLADVEAQRVGEPVEVDHVVPLNSPVVCGLHWEGNLQLMRRSENRAKGNRWWPGMPEVSDAA